MKQKISTQNVSTTPLTAGSTFTGVMEEGDGESVMIFVATDQDGTLYAEFSVDGENWDTSLSTNYRTDRINPPQVYEKGARFFRVRFTNTSSSDQTYLRLYCYFGSYNQLSSPINGTVAESFNALNVRPTDYESECAMGKRQGRSVSNKFGFNLDVDSAAEEIIASFGGSFDPTTDVMTSNQTFTISYNNTTDGDGTTGALSLLFTYVYFEDATTIKSTTGIHTLGSTGSDVTSFSGCGINRCLVLSSGSLGYNANDITITATTDATTQAQIPTEKSVTEQLIFHTQTNHNFLADWARFIVRKLSGGSAPRVTIRGYSWSRVTETRYLIYEERLDSAIANVLEVKPSQKFPIGGREVLYFTCDSDTNNTTVSGRFSGIEERVS
jgi:hypothetical protein